METSLERKFLYLEALESRTLQVPVLNETWLQRKNSAACNVFIGRFYCVLYICTLLDMHYTYQNNLIFDFASCW
jgi:hypothetical protein